MGENFFLLRKNSEARNPFRIAGFIYPGSYLLSRDLSSDKTPEGSEGGWPNRGCGLPPLCGGEGPWGGPEAT